MMVVFKPRVNGSKENGSRDCRVAVVVVVATTGWMVDVDECPKKMDNKAKHTSESKVSKVM